MAGGGHGGCADPRGGGGNPGGCADPCEEGAAASESREGLHNSGSGPRRLGPVVSTRVCQDQGAIPPEAENSATFELTSFTNTCKLYIRHPRTGGLRGSGVGRLPSAQGMTPGSWD